MRDNPRSFSVIASEQVGVDRLQWIEVMPTAEKARNGRWFFTITRDDLETYAKYIRANPDRIPVDYDHAGADGGSTVAAGWFTGDAEVRDTDDGPKLYAIVEWTPQGLEDVKSKRFRFISPEFSFKNTDSKTGLMTKAKELLAATVTNRPFFDELAALAAASSTPTIAWSETMGFQRRMDALRTALNGEGSSYPPRYCVVDVDADTALVSDWDGVDAWVLSYSIDDEGKAQVGPASEWTSVEQQWVIAADVRHAAKVLTAISLGEDPEELERTPPLRTWAEVADVLRVTASQAERLGIPSVRVGDIGTRVVDADLAAYIASNRGV